MSVQSSVLIQVSVSINVPVAQAWEFFTNPVHIVKWNHASDDWHTTAAENDLRVGGRYSSRMEAKDGSFGFDFWGVYDQIQEHQLLRSNMGDGRSLRVQFIEESGVTTISEDFETEPTHSIEQQRDGWQAILNNLKCYAEGTAKGITQ